MKKFGHGEHVTNQVWNWMETWSGKVHYRQKSMNNVNGDLFVNIYYPSEA